MALVNVTISDKPPVPADQGDIWINQTTREVQMHNGIQFAPFVILSPVIDSGLTIASGDLDFTGTAQRISGDFSNATFSNRLTFQSSTANGNTSVGLIPNGSATGANHNYMNANDPANTSQGFFGISSSAVFINSAFQGTGTQLPIKFQINNTDYLTIPAAGGVQVNSGGLTVTAGGATITAGGLTVSAGGATVTAGGLKVTAGNLGIGVAPDSFDGINLATSIAGTSGFGKGIRSAPTFQSTVTTDGPAVYGQVNTAAASFTLASAYALYAANPSKGSGSTITSAYGLYVESMTAGGTNNYGIYVNAPSGGSGANVGVYVAGGGGSISGDANQASAHQALFANIAFTTTDTSDVAALHGASNGSTFNTNVGVVSGVIGVTGGTVNTGKTVTRITSLRALPLAPTVNGTLSNHNALYLDTPSGGSTNRVIDSASGGYLSTAGSWTNSASWAEYKSGINYVKADDLDALYSDFVGHWRPATYRHDGTPLKVDSRGQHGEDEVSAPQHQDYEYDTFFALLDDLPETIRKAICVDAGGGIGTKDADGFLAAMILAQAKRIEKLEARVGRN